VSQEPATILQAIDSDDEGKSDRTRLRSELTTHGKQNEIIEKSLCKVLYAAA